MIVKVQMPRVSDGSMSAFVCSEDSEVKMHVPVSTPLLARMAGRSTKFFNAALVGTKTKTLELGDTVADREW